MKKRLTILMSLCWLINSIQDLHAQQQLTTVKKSYTDNEGKLYWNKEKPVYLRISDTPEGSGQLLKSQKSEPYTNPMYLDTEGLNYIRSKYAVDPNTKEAIVPQQEVLFEIYADGEAPVTTFEFNDAPKYTADGTVYFGKGLDFTLTAADKNSGVAQMFYAVNKVPFSPYGKAVMMDKSGEYGITYYSVDNVGNVEAVSEKRFVVDLDDPVSYYNINGMTDDKIIGQTSKIYITREDSSSGIAKTFYKFDDESYKTYTGRDIPFAYLEDGTHTLTYYSEDNVGNREPEQKLEFYFDKSAPIVAADILGDRFIAGDIVYFSGRTKLKLTAIDNKSGVKDVLYSIDDGEFKSYEAPFYLPNKTGTHVVRFYSLDNMANNSQKGINGKGQEFKHNVRKVYVDLTGPSMEHTYIGPSFRARDTVFISPKTKVKLSAKDEASGLQHISYSMDGAMDEIRYDSPFSIAAAGHHKVELFGYDNVNNRNIDGFEFVVDKTPPKIIFNFSTAPIAEKDGVKVYPPYTVLYLAATDKETGVNKIHYSIDGGAEKVYSGFIQGLKKGKTRTIDISASDHLGNTAKQSVKFMLDR